jgi:NADH-quinone oxidoreductase subunit C
MPDATGLELIAQELEASEDVGRGAVLERLHHRERASLTVEPGLIAAVLEHLRARGYTFLASVHGVDYYPEEPRLGVLYELLNMADPDRISVKVRVSTTAAEVPSITDAWPSANLHEREVYDMFGVVFRGHPDLRRVLMPEDYEGHPQRRDFPVGGEPVLFTYNDTTTLGSPE